MSGALGTAWYARLITIGLLLLATLHVLQVWGTWGFYWGDPGQVLGQLERVAHGQTLYRDVVVFSPPLGYWLIGLAARFVGTEPAQISLITSVLFLAVVFAWWSWLRRLVRDDMLGAAVAVPALALAAALALSQGVALPLGSYAPGAPAGFLCLIAALLALGDPLAAERSPLRALACGVLCGGCVLAKQDFWAPAAFVAGSAFAGSLRRGDSLGGLCVAIGSIGATLAGCVAVALSAGWSELPLIATGYGVASESGFARAAPSLEILTLEAIGLSMIIALGAAAVLATGGAARRALRAFALAVALGAGLTALHFAASLGVAASPSSSEPAPQLTFLQHRALEGRASNADLARAEAHYLIEHAARRPLPLLLPLTLGVVLLWRRRSAPSSALDAALWWVSLCVAARLRRGFEGTDWFHALLELPVGLVAARALAPNAWRAPARAVLATAVLGAGGCWWVLGIGALSARGTPPIFESERGPVRFPQNQVASYEWLRDRLDESDPARVRPVFSFGHNGGIAYWLRRENPSRCTYGLTFCGRPIDALVADLRTRRPPPFLVYSSVYEKQRVPDSPSLLLRWQLPTRQNALMTRDFANFERAAEGCPEVARLGERRTLRLFDCPEPAIGSGAP